MDEQTKIKKCKCGKVFTQIIAGQSRCVDCIMKKEPKKATSNTDRNNARDFAEWFIYHWREIQQAAAEKFGVNFDKKQERN